jgi:hypothetical protein
LKYLQKGEIYTKAGGVNIFISREGSLFIDLTFRKALMERGVDLAFTGWSPDDLSVCQEQLG